MVGGWFQSRSEMAQEWGLVGYFVAPNLFAALPNVQDHLDCVLDMALGVIRGVEGATALSPLWHVSQT